MDPLARCPSYPEELSVWWRYTLTSTWVPQMINQWWSRIPSPQRQIDSNLASSLQFFSVAHHPFDLCMDRGIFLDLLIIYTVSVRSYMRSQTLSMWDESLLNRGSEGLLWSQKEKVCEENAATRRLIYWSRVILKLPWVITLYQSTKIPSPERLSCNEEIHLHLS